MFSADPATNRRRMSLIWIILGTIPCYCLGFIALQVPPPGARTVTPTATVTNPATLTLIIPTDGPSPTPNLLSATPGPSITPSITLTLQPSETPFQPPTLTYTPTDTVVPPTLTFTALPPSNTPVPPSNTPVPPSPTNKPPSKTPNPVTATASATVEVPTLTETPTTAP